MYVYKDSSLGNVIVCFYSRSDVFLTVASRILKENFHISGTKVSMKGIRVYSVYCKYSIEDKLYPLLKKIAEEKKSEEDLIVAFGMFVANQYTEKIVLYKDIDYFHYDTMEKLTEEEKGAVREQAHRFRRKCLNTMYRAMAEETKSDKPGVASSYLQGYAVPEEHKDREKADDEFGFHFFEAFNIFTGEGYESFVYEEHKDTLHLLYGWPNKENKVYMNIGDGSVYLVNAFQQDNAPTPIYMPFEQFITKADIDIREHMKYGWYINIGDGRILSLTTPYETKEASMMRQNRDFVVLDTLSDFYPLMVSKPTMTPEVIFVPRKNMKRGFN